MTDRSVGRTQNKQTAPSETDLSGADLSETEESGVSERHFEGVHANTQKLRTGWTTGACAVAAARAACIGLISGKIPSFCEISLPKQPPKGCVPNFEIVDCALSDHSAMAAVIKDAGDDPDVTHGALIRVEVRPTLAGTGLRYIAGEGVGTVMREGLPIAVGEPAITPGPRGMMQANLAPLFALSHGAEPDLEIRVSIPDGAELARKTLNERLGIVGGLSILGTTGIVRPYSCAAWVASIHRGIDVARASGEDHIAACTGSTSETWAQNAFSLSETALLDMGDFVGATFKYLKRHPVDHVSLVGGFAKIAKLAQGAMDLHSRRSQLDMQALADLLPAETDISAKSAIVQAKTGAEALQIAECKGANLGAQVANLALQRLETLTGSDTHLDVTILDRKGRVVASTCDLDKQVATP